MLATGTYIGPYEILAPLGAGGMGEVYRARDGRLRREVAVKVLPHHLAKNPEALARFEREARTVAALAHPNILVLFDFGMELRMARFPGRELRDRSGCGSLRSDCWLQRKHSKKRCCRENDDVPGSACSLHSPSTATSAVFRRPQRAVGAVA
ncbi:MAG: hypothetical protein L0Y70_12105 [Gemmataceae bacterium]|nr:hypothetical protein [Gemmataceae bacterium]